MPWHHPPDQVTFSTGDSSQNPRRNPQAPCDTSLLREPGAGSGGVGPSPVKELMRKKSACTGKNTRNLKPPHYPHGLLA